MNAFTMLLCASVCCAEPKISDDCPPNLRTFFESSIANAKSRTDFYRSKINKLTARRPSVGPHERDLDNEEIAMLKESLKGIEKIGMAFVDLSDDLKIGEIGRYKRYGCKCMKILGKDLALVGAPDGSYVFILRGIDTSNFIESEPIGMGHVYKVAASETYTTRSGASKTARVIEFFDVWDAIPRYVSN